MAGEALLKGTVSRAGRKAYLDELQPGWYGSEDGREGGGWKPTLSGLLTSLTSGPWPHGDPLPGHGPPNGPSSPQTGILHSSLRTVGSEV